MKKLLLSLALIGLFLPIRAQYTKANLRIDLSPVGLEKYAFNQLMIIPVRSTPQFNAYFAKLGNFTVLKDAMASGKVTVSEVTASGRVNTLMGVNHSDDTIFGMAGQLLTGGKQDRMLSQNFLMYPGDTLNLSAFCVERGRWSASGAASVSNNAPVFRAVKGLGTQSLREMTIKGASQGAVWQKVAIITDKNGADSRTGTYNALWSNDTVRQTINGYTENLGSVFDGKTDVIGVICITGDTIIGCDLFATHGLFIKSYGSLLTGYATTALTSGDAVTIEPEEIQLYIDDLLAEENHDPNGNPHRSAFTVDGMKLHVTWF